MNDNRWLRGFLSYTSIPKIHGDIFVIVRSLSLRFKLNSGGFSLKERQNIEEDNPATLSPAGHLNAANCVSLPSKKDQFPCRYAVTKS